MSLQLLLTVSATAVLLLVGCGGETSLPKAGTDARLGGALGESDKQSWLSAAQRHIEAREYFATENRDGLQAPNRRHGLRTYFEPSGIRVVDRTGPADSELLELRLEAVGRPNALSRVDEGEVTSVGGRVEITRGSLLEWYLNDPSGLEQGFVLAERPSGSGPVVLELALTGAVARQNGHALRLATSSGRKLAYGKLSAIDAHGASLPVELLAASPRRIELRVDDQAAAYPIVIDPLLTSTPDTGLTSAQASAELGFSVASAGDVNGDGYADVIVGALKYDSGENNEGAAFLFHGSATGVADAEAATAATQLESDQANAKLGTSVSGAGDVNGDGYSDVVVGAPSYDDGEDAEGAAFVFLGSPVGVADATPATAATAIAGDQVDAELGNSVAAAGDVNGDGYGDVIIAAWIYAAGQFDEGAAFVFHGSAAGIPDGNPASADSQLEANQGSAFFGDSVAGAGDVNGDGYADVIAGASLYTDGELTEGAAFVFHGSALGIPDGNPATADSVLQADQATSRFGRSVSGAGDVNGDGYSDVIVGAYDYDAGETDEGAAFVFLGSASGVASGNPATAAAQLESNQASASLGFSVSSAGDVNGDGYADVIVGASRFDGGDPDQGIAVVFHGSATGIADGNPATAAAALESDQVGANLGFSVSSAGDVNGDGYADVLVGSIRYDSVDVDDGAAFVFLGGASGIASGNPTTAAALVESNQANGQLGFAVAAAGDVNGDGFADVIVGASLYDAGEADEGAAFVFQGGAAGITGVDPTTADAQLESDQNNANFGASVSGAGDVNNDGYSDVIVGASTYDAGAVDEGAAFIFHGSPAGIADGDPSTADAQLESNQVSAGMGRSVSRAGDVNGDGYADVIVGAHLYDAGVSNEGAAFLFHGGASGIGDGDPSTAATQLESDQASGQLGFSVSGVGDVNGDGYADVLVGAWLYDAGENNEGAAFVFHGSALGVPSGTPATSDAQIEADQDSAQLGISVSGAGDVNGDAYADVIVGANLYDAGTPDEGAAFIFHGSSQGIPDGDPTTADTLLESDQADARLGRGVSGAGDVNGDGYADVIVGAPNYDAGQLDEGSAFVFLGSAAGVANANPGTASAMLEPNQASATLGQAVSNAGDVNGDGYADVIVGTQLYDAGQNNEGAAFVFQGNTDGRLSAAQQREDNAGTLPIQPWGGSNDSDSFEVALNATLPGGRGLVKLEVEVCPPGAPFADVNCSVETGSTWTDVTATAGGVLLAESITPLVPNELHRWRARILSAPFTVTKLGITEPLNPPHGPWRRVTAQANEADVRLVPEPGVVLGLASGLALLASLARRRLRG